MNPRTFHDSYRQLEVAFGGNSTLVDVHEYRNNSQHTGDHGTQDGVAAYDELRHAMRTYVHSNRTTSMIGHEGHSPMMFGLTFGSERLYGRMQDLHMCFLGKGSPEAIAMTLQLVLALRIPLRRSLQEYVDRNIGLDCSGFVGNYLQSRNLSRPGPNTPAREFHRYGTPVEEVAGIRRDSVLTWIDHGHVAVVNRVLGPPDASGHIDCEVVESCGSPFIKGNAHTDGLNCSTYHVKRDSAPRVFKVRRTFPRIHPLEAKQHGPMKVYFNNPL